jgi:hypothetical protein
MNTISCTKTAIFIPVPVLTTGLGTRRQNYKPQNGLEMYCYVSKASICSGAETLSCGLEIQLFFLFLKAELYENKKGKNVICTKYRHSLQILNSEFLTCILNSFQDNESQS